MHLHNASARGRVAAITVDIQYKRRKKAHARTFAQVRDLSKHTCNVCAHVHTSVQQNNDARMIKARKVLRFSVHTHTQTIDAEFAKCLGVMWLVCAVWCIDIFAAIMCMYTCDGIYEYKMCMYKHTHTRTRSSMLHKRCKTAATTCTLQTIQSHTFTFCTRRRFIHHFM